MPMLWHLFCRVIDHHGDAGVCWRLAADLGARGERVRLSIDDASALAWMAPRGARGVEVVEWNEAERAEAPGEVVIEAFGCDPPPGFVERMRARSRPPLWINLEYLSAEPYVERSHGLPSPQQGGPGRGLVKWFFYPGFTRASGGLLREHGLLDERARFDAGAWLAAQGIARRPGERVASLFCYENAPLPRIAEALGAAPTLLLATPGPAARLVAATPLPAAVRVQALPWLAQPDYDRLLWSCDLNFVRGEDSFVRAQWAGAPFVWQIYVQSDGAHAAKLDAFLALYLDGADEAALARPLRSLWRGWNGLAAGAVHAAWPERAAWRRHALGWRERLAAQSDLATRLLGFASAKLQ
jgi:uncharacterized repeat protein (TIGR03837 family)